MLHPSDNPPTQQYRLHFLHQLVNRYPLGVVSGIWLALVLMSGVAVLGLLNPGSIEQQEQSTAIPTEETIQEPVAIPTPQTIQQSTPKSTASTEKDDLPLSLFFAIAVGCAVGSLVLTQVLKASTQPRQPSQSPKPAKPVGKKRPHPSKKRRPVPKSPQAKGSTKPTLQIVENGLSRGDNQHNQLTQITVLSPEEIHPLDRREQSLADMMDLRKRQSLSSLMRSR
jgi:hypothetical protein